jgi:peptidoglycan hydrolase-like protein with peptidoglycan-binding domain
VPHRSTGAGVLGTGTSAAVPVPAGAAVDDIVWVSLYLESTDVVTPPAGFTLKLNVGASSLTRGRIDTYWKRLTGSDTGTYTFTWTNSSVYEGVASAHTGIVRFGDPFETFDSSSSGGSTSTTVAAVVVPATHAVDIICASSNHATNAGDFTAPSGMTERHDDTAGGSGRHLAVYTQDTAAAGSYTKTATCSGTTGNSYPRIFVGALMHDRVLRKSAVATAGNAGTALTVTLPTTYATGDRLILLVSGKYDNTSAPTADQGFTLVKFLTGGSGSVGADTGTTFLAVFAKDATSSSETNPVITPGGTAPNTWQAHSIAYALPAGKAWADAIGSNVDWVQGASDTDTSSSVLSGTTTAFAAQPTTLDAVLTAFVTGTDLGSGFSVLGTISATGVSGGLTSTVLYSEVASGDDALMGTTDRVGFTGPASSDWTSAATFTATGNVGVVANIALRQGVSTIDLNVAGTMPQPTLAVSLAGFNDSDLSVAGTMPQPTLAVSLAGFNDSEVTAAGTMPQPTLAVNLNVSPLDTQLTAAGVMPQPTLAVTLAGFNDSEVTAAGTMPQPVLAVELEAAPTSDTIAVAGTMPQPTLAVSLSAAAVVATDTTNDDDGIYLGDGYAQVIWEPDIVEPPFMGPLTEDQVRVAAQVIDTPPGALPAYTPAVGRRVYAPAARDRVLIDGVDFTYWNDAAVQVENMKLIDPLLYGGARITLPGINPQFPDAVLGDLFERFQFARVKVQRVRDGEVIATDTKGFVSRIDTSGTTLSLEVGGEAAGALSQMYVPPAVFRRKQDVEHIVADLLRDARVQAKEHDGSSGVGLIRRGGSDGLTIVNETIAVWAGAVGQAVTWTPNADGVYRKTQKSTDIVATAYIDSSLITQSLAQDFAEQWTRVYARGFTAAGEIVTNIKTPGLDQGDAPAFPLASGTLSVGMTDDDTTSGAGVTSAQQQLAIQNFLDFEDTTNGIYDALTERAVEAFQEVAGLNVTGEIGENTWDALWNLEAIGYSLDEAREYPMSQDPRTFKWFRTSNGSKKALNPDYDPHFIPNDLPIDVGGPFDKGQIDVFADSKRAPEGGVWTGTLTFRSGLIWGDHSPGDPVATEDVMDRRDLLPNMRIKLPHFAGGISVYVSGVDHGPDETTCLVSTVPQTTMETWQAIERRREAKSNPGRSWSGHTRASQVRNDIAAQWDTRGGRIAHKRALVPGWNEIQIPVGQAGIVQSIRMELEEPDEFAVLLTQRAVSVEALNNNTHTGDPLNDPRPTNRPWFEQESVIEWFDGRGWLDAWGTEAQPCGYDPSRKTDETGPTAQPITGKFYEAAGFNYETGSEPVLYLYVYSPSSNNLLPGRILQNQRTTDL